MDFHSGGYERHMGSRAWCATPESQHFSPSRPLHHPDFLGALAALGDRAAALEAYMQPDGMHPNRDGVQLIVSDIGPSVLRLLAEID
ncbi:MAG: hypothetical protein F4186_06095 [Boseongicola sp. SB0676_bin_33]|nr:hypothetical protein [Boseongicola sp. SB0676_bin_33]